MKGWMAVEASPFEIPGTLASLRFERPRVNANVHKVKQLVFYFFPSFFGSSQGLISPGICVCAARRRFMHRVWVRPPTTTTTTTGSEALAVRFRRQSGAPRLASSLWIILDFTPAVLVAFLYIDSAELPLGPVLKIEANPIFSAWTAKVPC